MACPFCTMPNGRHDDECPYDAGQRSTSEKLVELAKHCAEGRIDGVARDISHHSPRCPCESHLLERMQQKK